MVELSACREQVVLGEIRRLGAKLEAARRDGAAGAWPLDTMDAAGLAHIAGQLLELAALRDPGHAPLWRELARQTADAQVYTCRRAAAAAVADEAPTG